MQHEGSPTQDRTITLSSTQDAPFNFVISISQPDTGGSPARSVEVTGPDPDLGSRKTCQYHLSDSGHNSYLDLFLNLARDFGTRLPLNRRPASRSTFEAKYHALLTENLAPGMLYGYGDPAVLYVEENDC